MMFQTKLAAFIGALLLTSSVFSAPKEVCPSLSDIQAEGMTSAEEIAGGIYLTYTISHYQTKYNWGFIIAPITTESADDAIDLSNDILAKMTAPGVPGEYQGELLCEYRTGHRDIIAAALRDSSSLSPSQLKQYFQSKH